MRHCTKSSLVRDLDPGICASLAYRILLRRAVKFCDAVSI
jgi:hypothetical protein